MLARGIRSYHRPARLEEAFDLAARGATPLAGGTRLLATPGEVPNVLDLAALGLGGIGMEDGDLVLGSMATLQEAIDSPLSAAATGDLLPLACRAQCPSRTTRSMATLGGESVHGAHDSEVVTALLALNAVYVIAHPTEPKESPALRFLRQPAADLAGGGLVKTIVIPGAPGGAAFERLASPASAPALVAVAVTIAFAGTKCTRARIAVSGLEGRPARILEAEGQIEHTTADDEAVARAVAQLVAHAPFRSDSLATARYRAKAAGVLAGRALSSAIAKARQPATAERQRARRSGPAHRAPNALPYFTSGRIELTVNGRALRADVEARTTLLQMLRKEGLTAAKDGCGAGECGACTVLLEGRPANACLVLALRAQGRSVQTAEGLAGAKGLHRLQNAFQDAGAALCGFCTPAFLLQAKALLDAHPDASEAEIKDGLSGVVCPCNGGSRAVTAVTSVAGGRSRT
ncbi:MAG TPA: FAD binding domain-containing protein [Vicinamibacteria bacterium]|nr:FAD binding domain-containing protein [Vicinamibacteria bacterium]